MAFCVFFYQAIERPDACHISFGKVLFLHFFCHLTNPCNTANWHNAQLPCVFFVWVAACAFSAFSRFLRFANKKCPSRRYPCAGWALVCFWCYAFDAGPATRVFTPAPPGIFAASNSAAQTRQWSAGWSSAGHTRGSQSRQRSTAVPALPSWQYAAAGHPGPASHCAA